MHEFSIAPMMDRTDLHYRNLMRLISKNIILYTEMIHANAILHDKFNRFKIENECKGPTVLQIGCSDPKQASKLSKVIKNSNFKYINLNCGCPSDKVIKGDFGAILMKKPILVAEIIDALQEHTNIPITIKTRIGVDNFDNKEFLYNFINITHKKNISSYIIHARKAILKGLTPHENRTIPPLNYERVKYIKNSFKQLKFTINGGINSLKESKKLLKTYDGVMVGRYAWDNPWEFIKTDSVIFGDKYVEQTRTEILEKYLNYSQKYLKLGHSPRRIIKPLFNLLYSCDGSRYWKQELNNVANNKKPLEELLKIIDNIESKLELAA